MAVQRPLGVHADPGKRSHVRIRYSMEVKKGKDKLLAFLPKVRRFLQWSTTRIVRDTQLPLRVRVSFRAYVSDGHDCAEQWFISNPVVPTSHITPWTKPWNRFPPVWSCHKQWPDNDWTSHDKPTLDEAMAQIERDLRRWLETRRYWRIEVCLA